MTEILEDVKAEPVKTAQTPAPETEPTGWMSPDGEVREGAPEAVKNLLDVKKWNTVEQLVEGFVNLEKFTGIGKHLVIPEADDAEGWNNVYSVLGRPETHDKYAFDYDGEVEISDELVGQFKQFAHGLGLTQKQFNDVVRFQLDAVTAQNEAYNVQFATLKEENIKALKQKWGEANYEVKVKEARIIADKLGIYKTLEAKGLASDPEIISMLDTIASRTAEDVITPPSPPTPTKTPEEEREELNKSDAWKDKFHPKHKEVQARIMELNKIIATNRQADKLNSPARR